MAELGWLILGCAGLRGLGLALAGRMGADHPLIRWAAAVAMATLAAFVAQALLWPSGALATLPPLARLGGMAAAGVLLWWRGGLLGPVLAGVAVAALLSRAPP
ncbi:AzlD domain-containing protein [Roseococcus sp. DSY-14]|uniref:AzlD domain-containing protein n=1 Tax=Roseococcus sp. DSY-14 TaxID=3369650 RepID=UPI00387B58BA